MDRQVVGRKGCGWHKIPTEQQSPAGTWGNLRVDVKLPAVLGRVLFQENRL